MRILLVTQMWPGPSDPDLGVFVFDIARELRAARARRAGQRDRPARRGAGEVRAAERCGGASRRGAFGPTSSSRTSSFPRARRARRRRSAARVPLVVMAHGTDVENARRSPALARATRLVTNRCATVICNSRWLARRLGPVRGDVRDHRLRRRSRGLRAAAGGGGAGARRMGRRRPGLSRRRLADRAQGRRRARRRVRGARARQPRVRRRRPAALAAGGPAGRAARRARAARRGGRLDRGLRRALPAVAAPSRSARRRWRAWRWSAASWRRPRAGRRSSSRRRPGVLVAPGDPGALTEALAAGRAAAVAQPGGAGGGRRARRPASGGADGRRAGAGGGGRAPAPLITTGFARTPGDASFPARDCGCHTCSSRPPQRGPGGGRYGVEPCATDATLKAGVARNVRDGVEPLNGLRHPPEGDTSGWYLWAGGEPSGDPDFFMPVHVSHLAQWCPAALPSKSRLMESSSAPQSWSR